MTGKKEKQEAFTMCLEDIPCAEMMQKLLGQKGIGSLCADMMKKMQARHGDKGSFACAEMLRSMTKGVRAGETQTARTDKEEGHDRDE